VLCPPLRETIGAVVGRPSGSRSGGNVMTNGRVHLKQGVYYTEKLVYKLVNRYLMPKANGDGRLPTAQSDVQYSL
jgi:hypothetical protein